MADVIPHASTAPTVTTAVRRGVQACAPALLVGVLTVLAAEWTWWLHPGGLLLGAAPPAAGVLLGALLLLAPGRWPAPIVVSAAAVGLVAARHDAVAEVVVGRAVSVAAAAVAAAVLLRWYEGGAFRLDRVRELGTLVVAAAVGAVLGAALDTLAWTIAVDLDGAAMWRAAWPTAVSLTIGMVLVAVAILTAFVGVSPARRRGGPLEALVLAVAVVAVSIFADRAVGRSARVLGRAPPRVGCAPLRDARRGVVGARDGGGGRLGRGPRRGSVRHDARYPRRVDPAAGVRGGDRLRDARSRASPSTSATPPKRRAPRPPSASGAPSTTPPSRWPSPLSTAGSSRPTAPCARSWSRPTTAWWACSCAPSVPTTAASTTSRDTPRPARPAWSPRAATRCGSRSASHHSAASTGATSCRWSCSATSPSASSSSSSCSTPRRWSRSAGSRAASPTTSTTCWR